MMDSETIWAEEWLAAHAYDVSAAPELIRAVPWSKIYRLNTDRGNVYLKWSAPAYAREAALMVHLAERFPSDIPSGVAANQAIGAFLMSDGGEPLRNKLKRSYDPQFVGKLLGRYARIQRTFSHKVEPLLALGLDDWRTTVFPDLYDGLVHDEVLLEREGLSVAEIEKLQGTGENIRRLCRALAGFKVPDTLEHCDFHDNNVLVKADGALINDWGDAVISHPFFSLAGFLDGAVRNHGLDANSLAYKHLKDAYFEIWLDVETPENLERIFEIAVILRPIEFAFNFSRVIRMTTTEEFEPYRGYIAEALRRFLSTVL
ncbi:aminoglycoside phosphotransferase family protein [Rhizobium binxianense]|uniref:aminoglycoside phosphotransferase family protein n=1 Tax=Rhizobium binxianense TaxID=3024242 RepID=UPI0023A9F2FC|nr:aminoglycoside phosphotransferase family protein [Rhizobium sp. MJ22]WEA24712.1 aminoglycoside phosphotransferase family protein [Rhizobium sp. MJ22]